MAFQVTPLMLAAARGDLDIVKFLVANKAKVEKPDKFKRTALTHAVMNGAANTASYLLSLGADFNKTDTSGMDNAKSLSGQLTLRVIVS